VPIVSFSISGSLLKEMELMADVMGYTSRSEVIRDALRSHISEQRMYCRAKLTAVLSVWTHLLAFSTHCIGCYFHRKMSMPVTSC